MAQDGQPVSNARKPIGVTLPMDDYLRLKEAAAAVGIPTDTDSVLVRWAVNLVINDFAANRTGRVARAGVAGGGPGDGQGGPPPVPDAE